MQAVGNDNCDEGTDMIAVNVMIFTHSNVTDSLHLVRKLLHIQLHLVMWERVSIISIPPCMGLIP